VAIEYRDGQWRDLDTGEVLVISALVSRRDKQILAWQQALAQMARDELRDAETGGVTESGVKAFGPAFLESLAMMLTAAFVYAAGGATRMDETQWGRVAELVGKQQDFASNFLDALRAGQVSGDEAIARSGMYAGSAVEAFEQGRASQLGDTLNLDDLPGYPGDGLTQCLSNCRCYWSYEETASGWDCYWNVANDEGTCVGCMERGVLWAPYTINA
jgi:hypothetical protein